MMQPTNRFKKSIPVLLVGLPKFFLHSAAFTSAPCHLPLKFPHINKDAHVSKELAPRRPTLLRSELAQNPVEPNSDSASGSRGSKEVSYAAILKVIDDFHQKDITTACPYLPKEPEVSSHSWVNNSSPKPYQSPITPILSPETANGLRSAAQSYFEQTRDETRGAFGQEVADLGRILSTSSSSASEELKKGLYEALIQQIYPLVRASWSNHDALLPSKNSHDHYDEEYSQQFPSLVVTSATVAAAGGYPGAKGAMTTLERDAGLFTVHIDLGNENEANPHDAMGGIYLESLVSSDTITEAVVGPLSLGQAVIHRSNERTAAFIVPANLRDVADSNQSLDSTTRRNIIQAAETSRHYGLRLVLTTTGVASSKRNETAKENDGDGLSGVSTQPEAPAEERAYRLRNFARFREDRIRYLTLAGLLDVDDHENHLWLGFDYIARVDNPEYRVDVNQRLSDVNKAIFHLEKAAELGPRDARVHFQLATALGAKMDCEKSLMKENSAKSETEAIQLSRVAAALERSAILESTAVKLGINGINDLATCLHALAETRCKMGEFDKALDVIDRWAECGSIRSDLAIENVGKIDNGTGGRLPMIEWLKTSDTNHKIAVKTIGDVPVFTEDDISMLRDAADRRFSHANGVPTSRYTMQYEGNSEVHLDDLCAADPSLKMRIDKILQNKVYPLVRKAFANDDEDSPEGPLCVYDSIFVRYNGDQARALGRDGASQPLHQDGGIYSINIALNSHKDISNENGFTGGGTFFEAFTDDQNLSSIQRPESPGHAIFHKTTARHAGAPTTSGIRDILVIFLTARKSEEADNVESKTWRIERAMRLQSIAKELPSRDLLIPCLEIAKSNDPTNSEMSYWLGVHLLQGDMNDPSDERWNEICYGVDVLRDSTLLNPADARAHYHHGMAISARHKYAMRTQRAHLLPPADEAANSMINAFEMAIRLERKCAGVGCKNCINLAAGYLTLADFMARLKSFEKAIVYLEQIEGLVSEAGDLDQHWAPSMLQQANSMMEFCTAEMAKNKRSKVLPNEEKVQTL